MVWPVFTLPTRGLNIYTLPTWTSIRYPPLLKSGVKICFIFTFMSLSSKTKNNRKNSNKQDQRWGFCRETRCVSKQDQMDKPTHLVHHFSISLASLCQSLISLLSHSSLLPTTHFRFIIFVFHLAFLRNEHGESGSDLDCRTMLDY